MPRFVLLLTMLSACAVARAQPPADAGAGTDAPEEGEPQAGEGSAEESPGAEEAAGAAPPARPGEQPPPVQPEEPPAQPEEPPSGAAGADAGGPPQALPQQLPEEEEGLSVSVGLRGGYALQPDQLVAGPHLAVRGILADFLGIDTMVLAGMATEHWTLRIAAHVKLTISAGDFRVFPLVGPAAVIWRPRGRFADWCDKLQLECSGSAFGMELGLGAGWRMLGVEAYLATGELPLLTVLGSVTLDL